MSGEVKFAMTNGRSGESGTLLALIRRAAVKNTGKGTYRHIFILTCYFDMPGLIASVNTLGESIHKAGGTVAGITIVVDVTQWIKSRLSKKDIVSDIARSVRLNLDLVTFVPAWFPSQLLHAKAYAAIRPGKKPKRGFVVITSGNATERGLGLIKRLSNLELAMVSTDESYLQLFEQMMAEMVLSPPPMEKALKNDKYLQAFALFSSGEFYHRWQGSLSAEVRFKLTLTKKGLRSQREENPNFPGYRRTAKTISRDPLNLEKIFERTPKPFPLSFWRTYSVETALGYWLPRPIAALVDEKLSGAVDPYMIEIQKRTSANIIDQVK